MEDFVEHLRKKENLEPFNFRNVQLMDENWNPRLKEEFKRVKEIFSYKRQFQSKTPMNFFIGRKYKKKSDE
jgi:hypothetical protein